MELSGEDSLRLNVLLAKPLCAIRMDEARMTVHALNHQRSPMQLNIIIDDATVPVTVPDTLIAAAADFFGMMDGDMDKGWQMSADWVERPDQVQRCQIVANRLLAAFENENQRTVTLMAAYILKNMPGTTGVDIDTIGDMAATRFLTD